MSKGTPIKRSKRVRAYWLYHGLANLTIKEVAGALGISYFTAHGWLSRHKFLEDFDRAVDLLVGQKITDYKEYKELMNL